MDRIYGKQKYCSPKCSSKAQCNKIKLNCNFCEKEFEISPSKLKKSKSGLHFCSRECKDLAQSIDYSILKIKHYDNGSACYRTKAFRHKDNECEDCGESQKFMLIVHHINGDRTNNSLDNLEILCRNCHTKRHLKLEKGHLVYDSKCLTNRDLLNTI